MSVLHPAARALAALALLLSAPAAAHAAPAQAPRLEPAVDAYLRPLVDLDLFQGAILIARGDQILLEKGYGFANLELQVRNTPAQVFRIASLTKPFTEVALGRLVEEGRLDFAAPLSRYVPGFPNGDRITIEMLRTHRAGIANLNSIPYDEEARHPNTLDSLVRVLAAQPLSFEPGSRRGYSNGGYALLGHVIERITGRPYADHLQSAVLRPLGLADTRHEADQMLIPNRAYGYTPSPDERGVMVVAPFQEMATKTGGGSLVSTVRDLHRFMRAMYGSKVLKPETWRLLFPPDSVQAFQGRCPGFNVLMRREFTDDVVVVVLSNDYATGMAWDIGVALVAIARGLEVAAPPWRNGAGPDSARAAAFIGTWRPPAGALPLGDGSYAIRWHKHALAAFRDGTPFDVLIPQGDGAFLLRNAWSELRFVPPAAGPGSKVTMRALWQRRDPVVLERVDTTSGTR